MKHGIMIWSFFEKQWFVRVGQGSAPLFEGMPFDLRIQAHFYEVDLLKDTDWYIFLDEVRFNLCRSEVYRIRIDTNIIHLEDDELPF